MEFKVQIVNFCEFYNNICLQFEDKIQIRNTKIAYSKSNPGTSTKRQIQIQTQ